MCVCNNGVIEKMVLVSEVEERSGCKIIFIIIFYDIELYIDAER